MASLRQRMLEDMQVRRLSACTQRTYVETVARFARYFDRSPARLGPEQIRAYQVYLTNERRLAPSSLVVAVSALRFLYRVTLQKRWVFDDMIPAPKKPRSLPVVLSPEEVVQFLDGVKAAKHHAILTTCYAAGLRISEAVHLTVSAIDSERMVLRIAKGKGQKDRYVMLSPKLLATLSRFEPPTRPGPLGSLTPLGTWRTTTESRPGPPSFSLRLLDARFFDKLHLPIDWNDRRHFLDWHQDRQQVARPRVERRSFLCVVRVSVVDGGDTVLNMVEHLPDD